jgi:regulator of nucleoside diphosphate kinase
MSRSERCIFTTKDFSIIESMKQRCLGQSDPLAEIIRRKLSCAVVMFLDDIPTNVVTLNSRVTYSVDGGSPDTRIVALGEMRGSVGTLLPITNPRGLALLGLAEGESFTFCGSTGSAQTVTVEAVVYQPEAAKRNAPLMAGGSPLDAGGFPGLRLVHSADDISGTAPAATIWPRVPDNDDPGPTAA